MKNLVVIGLRSLMVYKLLWNFKLWLKGIMLIVLYPFVLAYKIIIDFPINWAKEFESERED